MVVMFDCADGPIGGYHQDIDGDWVKDGVSYSDPFTGKDIDGDYVGNGHGGMCN